MKTVNVAHVADAHRTYPQWNNITAELTDRFKDFHEDLKNHGYEIKACNIAVKDKKMFWILLCENGWYGLEHYATLID
jgi:hypothetical protein